MADTSEIPLESGGGSKGRIARNHLVILFSILGLWEAGSHFGMLDPLFFPRPSDILIGFWRLYIVQANIWGHLGLTMAKVIAGFIAGSILGIALALVVGMSDRVRRYMKPYVIITEATPRIAIGPVIIAAFGFGWTSTIVIVMLVCFFAPFVNTLNGMVNVDRDKVEMMRSMRATRWQIFVKLMLPDALPEIMGGLRLAMASALGGALVAEFIAANAGMGVLISRYTSVLNMASAFVCVLTLSAVGYGIIRAMEGLDRRIVFWNDRNRTTDMAAKRALEWARKFKGTV